MKNLATNTKICSICEIYIEENYCTKCGQEYTGKIASILLMITDFFSNFFSVEKSGFATILKILKNPKHVVNNYHLGYRNYYASPGKMLLYGIAIVAIHLTFVDANKVLGISLEGEGLNAQYLFWILLIPTLLFVSYLTFFRIEKRLSKHLVSIVYIATSVFIVLIILNDLASLAFDIDTHGYGLFIMSMWVFIWNSRVFTKSDKKYMLVLNTLLQYLILLGFFITLMLITK